MAQHILRLRLFISAPGDLDPERQLIRDVVDELNKNWGGPSGVEVEVLHWKDDVVPDVSSRGQAVVNEQLSDYDIYLGILGHRFGQPTGAAGSGTEEEFDLAFDRHQVDPSSVRIVFYFKNTPVSPSDVDAEQLLKVHAFKERIAAQGVLYGSFSDSGEFGTLLRLHLSRVVQGWRHDAQALASPMALTEASESSGPGPDEVGDDRGLLDLLSDSDEIGEEFTELMSRMGDAITELGGRMKERSDQLSSSGGLATPAQRKLTQAIIARTVGDVNHFTARLKGEVPLFADTYATWIEAHTRLLSVLQDFSQPAEAELAEAREQTETLLTNLSEAGASITSFRETMAKWPRISAGLNRAKREALSTLDALAVEMTTALNLTAELSKGLNEL